MKNAARVCSTRFGRPDSFSWWTTFRATLPLADHAAHPAIFLSHLSRFNALCLSRLLTLVVRWIPSEVNHSHEASRITDGSKCKSLLHLLRVDGDETPRSPQVFLECQRTERTGFGRGSLWLSGNDRQQHNLFNARQTEHPTPP